MPAQTNAGILHTNYSPHNAVSAYRPGFFAVNPESFSGSFPVSYTGTRNPRRDSGECGNTENIAYAGPWQACSHSRSFSEELCKDTT